MRYLVMLLLVLVQVSPVPRQTAKNDGQANDGQQNNARGNKAATPRPTSVENLRQADVPQPDRANTSGQDEGKAVKVIVPPINVTKDPFDYAVVVSTLLLTVATFVIALYAAVQARAAKKSAADNEKAVRLTQRADVLLESIEIKGRSALFIDDDSRLIFHVKNFGPTRADDLVVDFRLSIPGVPDAEPSPRVSIVLGAGDSKPIMFRRLGDMVNTDKIRSVASGELPFTFSGAITYRDVFDASHAANYRGTFNAKTGGFNAEQT